ncbi:MAG TPA: hypothetical protein VLJ58_08575 [Ramlibacter sp.]|nr:hypothetical protein [Ramlibacter sp.]
MKREEVEHVLRAAAAIAKESSFAKSAAGRQKDADFVRVLLPRGLINPDILLQRVSALPVSAEKLQIVGDWVRRRLSEATP